jgi:hypothetical protein
VRIELLSNEWRDGYEDGEAGKPAKRGASLSYLSGWIEGDAVREKWRIAQRA